MANKGKRASYRTTPPLPFQGNKSIGRKHFLELLSKMKNGNEKTFVDLFGGSFYLSYLVHMVFPSAKIICNDFDGYKERLDNIGDTVNLISLIRPLIKEGRYKRIADETKEKIDEVIRNYEGYVDLVTLSSSLLFSSYTLTELEPFLNHEFYNLLINSDYDKNVDDYVEGIEFTHCDWKELFDEYKDKENVVFIADPPYMNTDKGGYSNSSKWGVKENLEVLDVLKTNEFIYYCSTKPGIIDFIQHLKEHENIFKDFKMQTYSRRPVNKQNHTNGESILYYFEEKTPEEIEEEQKLKDEQIREEKARIRREKSRQNKIAKLLAAEEELKKKIEEQADDEDTYIEPDSKTETEEPDSETKTEETDSKTKTEETDSKIDSETKPKEIKSFTFKKPRRGGKK